MFLESWCFWKVGDNGCWPWYFHHPEAVTQRCSRVRVNGNTLNREKMAQRAIKSHENISHFTIAIRLIWILCSVKKVLLKISQNLHENTCVGISFLIQLQVFSPQLFWRTPAKCCFWSLKGRWILIIFLVRLKKKHLKIKFNKENLLTNTLIKNVSSYHEIPKLHLLESVNDVKMEVRKNQLRLINFSFFKKYVSNWDYQSLENVLPEIRENGTINKSKILFVTMLTWYTIISERSGIETDTNLQENHSQPITSDITTPNLSSKPTTTNQDSLEHRILW